MREMKDSGIDWIGTIPQDWQLSKIGSLYTQRNEKVSDKDYQPLSVTMQGILPQLAIATAMKYGLIIITEENKDKQMKIPQISKKYGITSVNITSLCEMEQWKF